MDQQLRYLMELLRSRTMLDQLEAYSFDDFSFNSRYLWIWNPTNIPPHMGLSVDGAYFSLKANGVDLNSGLKDIIEIVSRKKIPVLAIELAAEFSLEDCQSVFSKHEKTIANQVTCLNPIKRVLKLESPSKLAELLAELDERETLGRTTAWNIKETFVELSEYSTEDIHSHLVSLSK